MFDKYLLFCKKKEERKSLLFVNEESTRKEATSAKFFKKFFSTLGQISWHNAPMHIDERLGCTAESGIWGHAYEAFKGGVHGARFFPCSLHEARAVVCENTYPACGVQPAIFHVKVDPMGDTDLVWEPTKGNPFEKSDST